MNFLNFPSLFDEKFPFSACPEPVEGKKKNVSRKNLRALLKKRSPFAEGIPITPYFSK
jgi:hypothetical protein